jgi:glycerophosphoryl diester phosphodiesterase
VTAAISAHRGGSEAAPAGTYDAYRHAVETGAEYVEFDVRRTADGELVVYHDARPPGGEAVAHIGHARLSDLAGYDVPRVADVMRLIAGHAIGHVDLKEAAAWPAVAGLALDLLGAGNFVVTTGADAAVAALRSRHPEVSAALTLSASRGLPAGSCGRRGALLRRIRACQADWVAVHHRLASAGLLTELQDQGIRAMVWTVNGDEMTACWLAAPGVDVVVTDHPARVIALRDRLRGGG